MGGLKEPSIWTKVCTANLNREPIAIDHRIYFALSLGTQGSPVVHTYRPSTLEEDLHKAAQGYCQEEIKFDKSNGIVVFPKLFKWHRAEFGWSTNNIISKILRYLSSDQILSLKDAAHYGGKNRVSKIYQNHAWEPVFTIPPTNQQQQKQQQPQKSSANMTAISGQFSKPQKYQSQGNVYDDSPTADLTPSDQSSFHIGGDDDDSTYVPYSIGEMTKLFSSGSVSDGTEFNDVLAKGTRNMLEDRDDTSTMYDIYDIPSVSSRLRAH